MAKYVKGFSEAHHGGRIRKTESGRFVAERSTDGKLRRATFNLKSEAMGWLKDLGARRDVQGHVATALTKPQAEDAIDALQRLQAAGLDIGLCFAVDDYIERHPVRKKAYTLQEVVSLHLESMKRRKCREDSITGTRKILAMLVNAIGADRLYTDIAADEVKEIVNGWDIAIRTKKNRVREIRTLTLFAEKEPLKLRNPIPGGIPMENEKQDEEAATVMTPKDVERFMRWVEENKTPRHAVAFALQFFAGLRPRGETGRIQWSDIRFNEKNSIGGKGVIRLDGKRTKTRNLRRIPITPNLREWLTRFKGEGTISPAYSGLSATRQEACKALGISWAPDITRHTFATASGEVYGQAKAAEWLGHEQTMKTFQKHYEGVLTHEQAQAFFNINPIPAKSGTMIQLRERTA